MAQSTPIATVVAVVGKAYARDAEGQLRELRPGDVVMSDELVISSQGGRVEFDLGNGEQLALEGDQAMRMTPELAFSTRPSVDDVAVVESDATAERILQALEQGGFVDDVL
ncbi:MAG: retention module-containing protein, partial [Gammaproteobacteria bacterium]|nr:retention module-containing protein [Gammaproteobacteria bacterium]